MGLFVTFLFQLLSVGLSITLFVIGGELYYSYAPTAIGDGIGSFSALWALFFDIVILGITVYRSPIGIGILFGVTVAMSIDLYPLWQLMSPTSLALKIQTAKIAVFWMTLVSSLAAWKYYSE